MSQIMHLIREMNSAISMVTSQDFKNEIFADYALSKEEVLEILQDLLKKECLQRDLYQAYDYLLFGPEAVGVKEHLQEHQAEEMEHIGILQRYIVGMGGIPTIERLQIPDIATNLTYIMAFDLEREQAAVSDYSSFIMALENNQEFVSLKVEIENILIQEQEHAHDLQRWLADGGGK